MPMNIIIKLILWSTYLISLYFAIFWFLVFIDTKEHKNKKALSIKPLVTIIIPAFNEEKRISATIGSVLNLKYPKNKLEIIIINDGSKDRTAEVCKKIIEKNKKFNIRLISQSNKGKGSALNTGLRHSKGEFFICFDADSYIEANALNKILPYFSNKKVAAVLPLLNVHSPTNFLQKLQWFEYNVNMFYKELMGRLNCIHVLPGPFSVYRKSILDKLHGFDEKNNLTEDLEMALRLQKHHYKIIQLSAPMVTTLAPDNFKALYYQRNRWYKGAVYNVIKYRKLIFNKYYGDFGMIQLPTILIAGVIALIMITSIIYYTIKPYVKSIYRMNFVGYDFLTYLRNWTFHLHFLELNYMAILVSVTMLFVSIVILKKSHSYGRESMRRFGLITLLIYLFSYFLILGIMWIGIAIDIIRGKKQSW